MQFSAYVTVIVAACLAAASPIHHKRAVGGILMCTGANQTGTCSYNVYPVDTCINMTAPYYQNAATFAPDGEEFYCYPYIMPCGGICTSPTGCTFGAVSYNSTRKENLTSIGWNKYISSFECHTGPAPQLY
ncbi:hypothetical protein NKR23_g2907 [Pleurostoma richardsiae]|uniref:Uncharacterized protein n=1 Tax=Pleurostoma richardsiae TaxID=41990 RepID=A0AA38S1D9_9PEZI|nr:hypothetical protein NKR23_g2907 [Pleurostoma richardsiae]